MNHQLHTFFFEIYISLETHLQQYILFSTIILFISSVKDVNDSSLLVEIYFIVRCGVDVTATIPSIEVMKHGLKDPVSTMYVRRYYNKTKVI